MIDVTKPQDFSGWVPRYSNETPNEALLLERAHSHLKPLGIDTTALGHAMAHSVRSDYVPTLSFLDSGSWNAVYKGVFPDGDALVAIFPYRSPQQQQKHISSIVATMTLALYINGVKCLRVFAWNASPDSLVGEAYIIMEFVPGERVDFVFRAGPADVQSDILDKLAVQYARLCAKLPFKTFGSVYFAHDATPTPDDDEASFYRRTSTYVIGPYICPPRRLAHTEAQWPERTFINIHEYGMSVCQAEYEAMQEKVLQGRNDLDNADNEDLDDLEIEDVELQDLVLFSPPEYSAPLTWAYLQRTVKRVRALVEKCALPSSGTVNLEDMTLIMRDFAGRNALYVKDTGEVVLIDFESVIPGIFACAFRWPLELCVFSSWTKKYVKTGAFEFLPPEDVKAYAPLPILFSPRGVPSLEKLLQPGSTDYMTESSHRFFKDTVIPSHCRQIFMAYLFNHDRRFSERARAASKSIILVDHLIREGYPLWISKSWWFNSFPEPFGCKSSNRAKRFLGKVRRE